MPIVLCGFMGGMLLLLLLYAYRYSYDDVDSMLRMKRYCKHGTFDAPVTLCHVPAIQAVPKALVEGDVVSADNPGAEVCLITGDADFHALLSSVGDTRGHGHGAARRGRRHRDRATTTTRSDESNVGAANDYAAAAAAKFGRSSSRALFGSGAAATWLTRLRLFPSGVLPPSDATTAATSSRRNSTDAHPTSSVANATDCRTARPARRDDRNRRKSSLTAVAPLPAAPGRAEDAVENRNAAFAAVGLQNVADAKRAAARRQSVAFANAVTAATVRRLHDHGVFIGRSVMPIGGVSLRCFDHRNVFQLSIDMLAVVSEGGFKLQPMMALASLVRWSCEDMPVNC